MAFIFIVEDYDDEPESGPAAYARRMEKRLQMRERELVTDVVAKEITMSEKPNPPSIRKLVAEMCVKHKGGWNFRLDRDKTQSGTAKKAGVQEVVKWRIKRDGDALVMIVTAGNDKSSSVVTNRVGACRICDNVATESAPPEPTTKLTFFEKKLTGSALTDNLTITSEHRTVDRLEGVFTDGDTKFDWWVVENEKGLHACDDVHDDSTLIRSIAEFDALLLDAKKRLHEQKATDDAATPGEEATYMVLVFEQNPEKLDFYKVPSHKKICAVMRGAQGQMINGDDLAEDAPVFKVSEWLQKYGKKYQVTGIVKGHITEIVHCGWIM